MEPVKQFSAALSTMFDHMMQVNGELRQKMLDLKADCDRLTADNTDALKVLFVTFFAFVFSLGLFGSYFSDMYFWISAAQNTTQLDQCRILAEFEIFDSSGIIGLSVSVEN